MNKKIAIAIFNKKPSVFRPNRLLIKKVSGEVKNQRAAEAQKRASNWKTDLANPLNKPNKPNQMKRLAQIVSIQFNCHCINAKVRNGWTSVWWFKLFLQANTNGGHFADSNRKKNS